ncbi:MAG: RAMP superfamily CRISPR-associated protein [Candidatus Korarchaeum sp.]
MREISVRIRFRGIRAAQPSYEVRKEDYRMMLYEKKVGDRVVRFPISPAQFKGALRQVACLVVKREPKLAEAYESLFGSDVASRCLKGSGKVAPPSSREGKLSFEIVSSDLGDDLDSRIELRPRIRINRRLGAVEREALLFSQAISSRFEVTFKISAEELAEEEEDLLRKSLNALRGWGVCGWTSIGYGIVEEVSFNGI